MPPRDVTAEYLCLNADATGTVSLHAARRGARVFAFEWDPVLLKDLEASVRANNFEDRVTIIAAFPCARGGSAVMFRRLQRAGSYAGRWQHV